jgi:excisionase family DNA binding protein
MKAKPKADEAIAYPFPKACEIIGVNESTGYALIARGYLRSFKVGRRRQVTRAACLDCVNLLQEQGHVELFDKAASAELGG